MSLFLKSRDRFKEEFLDYFRLKAFTIFWKSLIVSIFLIFWMVFSGIMWGLMAVAAVLLTDERTNTRQDL